MIMSSLPSPLFEGCPRGFNALTHTRSLHCTPSDEAPGQCVCVMCSLTVRVCASTQLFITIAEVRDGTQDT